MQSRLAAFTLLIVLALAPSVLAGGKKENKTTVTFHLETEATDNPKMIFPFQLANGQTRYFRRVPEISLKDIASFSPFPSTTGEEYGLVFRLKENAASRLSAISAANQGRWLLSQINGRVVDAVTLDKQINDGVMVIWQGITLMDLGLLDKDLPRAGAEGKKKK